MSTPYTFCVRPIDINATDCPLEVTRLDDPIFRRVYGVEGDPWRALEWVTHLARGSGALDDTEAMIAAIVTAYPSDITL